MKGLKLSADLALPVDTTVTSTLVVYGGKGMGKTNLGSVLVEELARCGLRWAWLDPLGVSWGLRHSADGAGPGIECLILGGPKGDIPIEPEGGAAVADVVIEEPHNVLVDFSRRPSGEMWSVGEKIRFVTAYAQRLFQRQGQLVGGRRHRRRVGREHDARRTRQAAGPRADQEGRTAARGGSVLTSQLQLDLDRGVRTRDVPADPEFFGEGYEPKLDQARLSRHCEAVLAVLRAHRGEWWTYEALAEASGVPPGSVRTRVSNLKRWRHPIETRTRPDRFREVRLRAPEDLFEEP